MSLDLYNYSSQKARLFPHLIKYDRAETHSSEIPSEQNENGNNKHNVASQIALLSALMCALKKVFAP
jgi:hypothetical protein